MADPDPAAPAPTPPAPASPAPATATATYDDFSKIELRVAKVLEARPHPNADKLMLLQIDVGDATKQIVAGIRQHTTPEALVGKLIVVVNNLAPAMLRGETSNGMLLAATSGDRVILLTVDDPDCVVGAKIK
jgi:tRNA-binding protein